MSFQLDRVPSTIAIDPVSIVFILESYLRTVSSSFSGNGIKLTSSLFYYVMSSSYLVFEFQWKYLVGNDLTYKLGAGFPRFRRGEESLIGSFPVPVAGILGAMLFCSSPAV